MQAPMALAVYFLSREKIREKCECKRKKNVKKKHRKQCECGLYIYRKYKFNWNILMSGPSLDV